MPNANLHVQPVAGLEGIKEASVVIEDASPDGSFLNEGKAKLVVVHGLTNVRHLLESIRRGEKSYHFIEEMTCPGGCAQPRFTDDSARRMR